MRKSSIKKNKPFRSLKTKKSTPKRKANDKIIEYVIPLGQNGWMIKNNQTSKFTLITDSKREALTIARSIAKRKKIDLMVFKRDGGGVELHERFHIK